MEDLPIQLLDEPLVTSEGALTFFDGVVVGVLAVVISGPLFLFLFDNWPVLVSILGGV